MDHFYKPFNRHGDSDENKETSQTREHEEPAPLDDSRHDRLEEGISEDDDPVEMLRQLRSLRKGIASGFKKTSQKLTEKTSQVVHGAQEQLGKQTRQIVTGSQNVVYGTGKAVSALPGMITSKGSRRAIGDDVHKKKRDQYNSVSGEKLLSSKEVEKPLLHNNSSSSLSRSNRGAQLPTESQPLLDEESCSSSAPSTRGAALWDRVKERRDSLILHWHSSENLGEKLGEDAETRRSRLSELYMKQIRRLTEYSLIQCLLAIVVYLAIAVLAYSVMFEKWTAIDSLYFACVTFTTIGYGDLSPTSDASRLFTSFFALGGVACLGVALGVIGSNLIDDQRSAETQAKKIEQYQTMSLFDRSRSFLMSDSTHSEVETTITTTTTSSVPWYRQPFVKHVLPVFSALFVCSWLLGAKSDWDVVTTFYFTIVTACTIGFGDFAPQNQPSRLFAVFYIPIAVGAMGQWLSHVANAIIDRRQAHFRKTMETRELTLQDIQAMDHDGDGQVTLTEYMEFMLVAMGKVDREMLNELRNQFDRLDSDKTGVLHKQDLVIVAKKKLHSPRRKLELAQYKKHLLKLSEMESQNRRGFSIFDVISSGER